jgi:hypothetical protein
MPIGTYKVWQWGGPVGEGVMESYHVGVHAIAKRATLDNPMAVANEVLCAMIGRGMTMPIPPHAVLRREEVPYHFSLNFNLAGESLPPCRPEQVVAELPELSCGVIVFDSWILNADRHDRNLAYLPTTNELQLFDHSHAFLPGLHGTSIFDYYDEKLPLEWHCLAKEIRSLDAMPMWLDRIMSRRAARFFLSGENDCRSC